VTADIVGTWEAWLPRLQDECVRAKEAQRVPLELSRAYGRLTDDERRELEPLLRRWILSDVHLERSAAISLARAHRLTSLVPELRALQERLESSTDVAAADEWAKVNRVLGQLSAPQDVPPATVARAVERSSVDPRFGRPMLADLAAQWRRWYPGLVQEAGRDGQHFVATTLSRAYAALEPDERKQLEPLLRSWLLSGDPDVRTIALGLAAEHRITALAPALDELVGEPADGVDPESRAWAAEVRRRLVEGPTT
jgi:hypothetical protein